MLEELEIRRRKECISGSSNGKSRESPSMSSSKADMIVEVEMTCCDPYDDTKRLVEKDL